MSIRVYPEPMPGNPAKNNVGDKTGLWRVVIDDGSEKDISKDNIPYAEAFKLSGELQRKYDGPA
jgi:hypothetical protein